MADDLIECGEEADAITGAQTNRREISNFPQTLVTEKIIFVIDILVLTSEYEDTLLIHTISTLLKSYMNLKKKICVKPEFECLLIINNDTINYSYVNTPKDLDNAAIEIKNFGYEMEDKPLEIDKVFNKIADLVKLPHPECNEKSLPPESVYHVVWLFGRNLHVPTMENTNSFAFLMMTPYFALDILYIYDQTVELNQCEQISQFLLDLNENGMGYFLSAKISSKAKLYSGFAQMLGHPLIRCPQIRATFNLEELGRQIENIKKNYEEEKKV